MSWITLLIALLFAAVHIWAGKLRFIGMIPRSAWLSVAGGVSVAYVFAHLLPEAKAYSREFHESTTLHEGIRDWLDDPVYLLALVGLITFYGLERWALQWSSARETGRGEGQAPPPGEQTPPGVFWVHIGSFGLYNLLITYLLVREGEMQGGQLALYATALGLHFIVNDYGLLHHHRHLYDGRGRWVLAIAALLGWGLGSITSIHPAATAGLFGFLSGGIVLNVLKEELPAERESRFGPFLLGAAGFTFLLLAV